jgi:DNA-3-methyladenine glycosylase
MYIIRRIGGHVLIGRITETECYKGAEDLASHACAGVTDRTQAMFGSVGHTYVYLIYGLHWCFNIVAKSADAPAGGVLIRAIEPIHGISYMEKKRNMSCSSSEFLNGPGKVSQALSIDDNVYGYDLTISDQLCVMAGEDIDGVRITATPRIGISKACDRLWRFVIDDESSA